MCRDERNHRVKLASPIDLPDVDLPISPYVLGCWLGDGSSEGNSITCGERALADEILKEGEILRHAGLFDNDPYRYVFNGGIDHPDYRNRSGKSFASRIRNLNLFKNKHIPMIYRRASHTQRLDLLQGLIDTDGSVGNNGEIIFCNTNRRLCDEVCELLNSLGYKAWLRGPYTAKLNGKAAGHFYQVTFKTYDDVRVFRLERKQSKLRPRSPRSLQNYRTIANIKQVESVPVRCIMVDAPSQLFLITDGFIPTHNTTAKRIDRAQWICAFSSEITILVESATQPLAMASAGSTARLFYQARGSRPRLIHLMFPELVVDRWPEPPWNTPNRIDFGPGDLDYTLSFTSPKSSQSGWHPFLIEPDDVEDTENSGIGVSHEVRQRVIDVCDQNENLLRDGGFINICGTRYHPFDWHAKCLDRAAMNPDSWEILVRSSLTLRNGTRLMPGDFPPEDDMILHFGEFANLSYNELREKFYANYESFMAQQMNDPQGGAVVRFEERFYNTAQIVPARIPLNGDTYLCWRPRCGADKKMAKYSEGAIARVVDGRIYILEAYQGQYTASGEAEKIAFQVKQHGIKGLMIIAVPGSDYLWVNVRNEFLKRNISCQIQWIDFEDSQVLRTAAIEQLEPMIKTGRVLFSTAMARAAETRKQFVHFGLIEEDGIAHCISKLAGLVSISLMRANMQEEELAYMRRRREDALLSQFLEQQGYNQADEMMKQKMAATLDAMSRVANRIGPPLPGGLDG